MHRKIIYMSVMLVFTLGFALAAFANVPAPPVNQILGIPDSVFTGLVESDCRYCHEDPNIVDDANIPNRHHLKVNTPVPAGTCAVTGGPCERNTDCPQFDPTIPGGSSDSCSVSTDRPFPAGDTMGNYDCYSCHNLIWDPVTMSSQFTTFRDCTFCHIQDPLAATVHHRTTKAINRECTACHGPIDDPRGCLTATNPDVRAIDADGNLVCDDGAGGNRLPTYDPSLVTPCPSPASCNAAPYKDLRADGAGQCEFCHDADPEPTTVVAPFTGVFGDTDVFRNSTNHHSTGVVIFDPALGQADCVLCHDLRLEVLNGIKPEIRGCEACHGPTSVHNIQVDSPMMPTGMIVPNGEMPYYGHIGSNGDCQGCHGFAGSAQAPYSGPIFANIDLLSAYNIVAGADTTITATGSAFQNEIMGNIVTASFVLTAADGSETTLAASNISASSADITIPGSLATGNYTLRAMKGANGSNATVISIIPGVTIASVDCDKKKGLLTVSGSGFGDKPEGTDGDLNVKVNGVTMELISWGDTQIKASVDRCRRVAVTVNALFGSADDGQPCKGKKCR